MINLITISLLSLFHWFADFVMQTDKQAKEKSSSIKYLLQHTFVYSSIIFICMQILQSYGYFGAQYWYSPLMFAGIQFVTHTIVDFFTSKINKRLWENKEVHTFFVMIGFDQLIHMLILFTSFNIIYG